MPGVRSCDLNYRECGPWRQVSRPGNPLVNEVLIPLGKKDLWNALPPSDDVVTIELRAIAGMT